MSGSSWDGDSTYVKGEDGSDDGVKIGSIGDSLKTSETLQGAGVQGTLTVGTTAVELKVGASKLANRKTAGLDNISAKTIYWGYTSAVTTANGRRIYKGQNDAEWSLSDNASVWLIAETAGNTIRVSESE